MIMKIIFIKIPFYNEFFRDYYTAVFFQYDPLTRRLFSSVRFSTAFSTFPSSALIALSLRRIFPALFQTGYEISFLPLEHAAYPSRPL